MFRKYVRDKNVFRLLPINIACKFMFKSAFFGERVVAAVITLRAWLDKRKRKNTAQSLNASKLRDSWYSENYPRFLDHICTFSVERLPVTSSQDSESTALSYVYAINFIVFTFLSLVKLGSYLKTEKQLCIQSFQPKYNSCFATIFKTEIMLKQ